LPATKDTKIKDRKRDLSGMKIDLSGKFALVTGGGRGIGAAIARLLAESGAGVVINYNKSEAEAARLCQDLRDMGLRAEIFGADVSDPAQVESLFEFIRKSYGRLDILVNNAGIIRDGLLLTMRLSDWQKVHDVNLNAVFLTTQRAAEMMVPGHCGKIINIASVSAMVGGRGQCNYASSKGGLVAFTRACAVELAGKGIQVNAVLPGVIETEMSSRVRKRAGEALLQAIPADRIGAAGEVAPIVVFLSSSLSDYITGQAISVDGGLSVA
jgi:3-oxoacyl-[acyl-carrier protein] reductase